MKFPSTAWRRGATATVAWLVGVALSGCGPGVGGTGSGRGEDGDKGIPHYAALSLCTAPFAASSLDCPADTNDADRGTTTVRWSGQDAADARAVALMALEAHTMSLQLPCAGISFLGTWGELDDGAQAFVGQYVDATEPAAQPAIAYLRAASRDSDDPGWLELRDPSGSRLFGPWLALRVDGEAPAIVCPSATGSPP